VRHELLEHERIVARPPITTVCPPDVGASP
jgi:hypothetical protein